MKKSDKKLVLYSLLHSLAIFLYTAGVAWFMFNGDSLFGAVKNFWGPLALLLLFILSAAITGLLFLGKPVMLYIDNRKKEALLMLFYTLMFLIIITLTVFFCLIIRNYQG